ncbi:MAG: hypothetical protein C0594_04860, partial [Marinilabiliales bacterium]
MKKTLFLLLVFTSALLTITATDSLAQTKDKKLKTVKIKASLDCQGCVNKVKKNIPFEKGVKDLDVSLETKIIKITYRADKNDDESLRKAVEKLGYDAVILKEEKTQGQSKEELN